MKNLFPTNVLALIALLLISKLLIGQWDNWSDAVSITDSISDNRNATIKLLNFIEDDYYIFWEKSTDALSTAIYYKNFYQADESHIFISDEGVHYKNPQLIDNYYYKRDYDSLFYVFYESDETGTNNIYYRVYNPDGFTEPQTLTTSLEEKVDLLCNSFGRIVWMEQNRIMHSKLDKYTFTFDEPFIIDSGNCSFPSVIQADDEWMGYDLPIVAWIKEENDSSRIMIRRYNSENGWLDAENIFTGLQCTNLSFCTGIGPLEILTWDYFNDTSWHILHYDLEDNQVYLSEFDQEEPFQPKFYSGIIPVKNRYVDAGICSFVYQNNDTVDIYSSPFYYGVCTQFECFQNVSESDNLVGNPKILSGKVVGCNHYFINLWEEQVNDHWQLKCSTSHECLSNIDEEDKPTNIDIKLSPNPFTEELQITFSLNHYSDIILSIQNASGVNIEIIESGKLNAGQHIYKWNGNKHNSGLYFVSLQSDSKIITKKIIFSK